MEDLIVNDNLIPPKESGFKKVINKIFALPLIPKMIIVIATFIVLSIGVYLSLAKDPQVAFMSIFGGGPVNTPVPVTPPVTPPIYPSPSPYMCQNGINYIGMSLSCGVNGFRYGTYTCNNGSYFNMGDGSQCFNITEITSAAINTCTSICSPTPSPKMSPVASAYPSTKPSPIPSTQPIPSGCELRSRMCIEGTTCPTFLVCAVSPTPVPTPSPIVTVTSTPKPVAATPTRYQLCKTACYVKFPFSNKKRAPCMNSCEARFR